MKGKKLSVVSDQLSVNSGDAGKKPEEYFFRASEHVNENETPIVVN